MMSIIDLATALGEMPPDVVFFYEHAGRSCRPPQTWAEGALEGARKLASAEEWARHECCWFDWSQDERDSREWNKTRPYYPQQACVMHDAQGRAVQSLCGIDFGRKNPDPHGTYVRVVQAELALEAMPS